MHMYFWWDHVVSNFHFYGFNISTVIEFVVACITLTLFSLAFEYVKMLQAKFRQKRIMLTQKQLRSICPTESDTLLANNPGPSTSTAKQSSPSFLLTKKDRMEQFVVDMSIWLVQNVMGYLLMLTIMLYNGYMVTGIAIGSAVGYFICGPTVIRINIENCRALRNTFCMSDCGELDKTALLAPGSVSENQSEDISPPICHITSTVVSETVTEVVEN